MIRKLGCTLLLPLALLTAQELPLELARQAVLDSGPMARSRRTAPAPGPSNSSESRVAARILCGNGWSTGIVLQNTGSGPVSFQQFFFSADGTPATFSIRSRTSPQDVTASAIQGSLTPGSILSLSLCDAGASPRQAWSLLRYDSSAGMVEGYSVLRRQGPGGSFSFETTVPLSSTKDLSLYMPFDNTQGFRSHLTLVNPTANLAAQVRLTYLNQQGEPLLIDSVTLPPSRQMTLILPDTYPDLANKTGSVLVETDIDRFSVMGLRCNDAWGVIAPLPVMSRGSQLQLF